MTAEALKALNVSQIDLYYLYVITRSRKHTHAITHNIYTCRLPSSCRTYLTYFFSPTTGTEITTVLHSILDSLVKIQN